MKNHSRLGLLLVAVLVVAGCGGPEPSSGPVMPAGESQAIEPPLGLPAVAIPADNPPTAQTINKFHNLGVGAELDGSLADIGRFEVSQVETDKGAFKTPHLRNIADSAPYMHDGHLKTLKEVVDFYVGAGNSNDFRDEEIHELDHLSAEERADLIAFMEALSGEYPDGDTAYRHVPAESLARGCFRADI